jgi:hypothetical protein
MIDVRQARAEVLTRGATAKLSNDCLYLFVCRLAVH